MRIVFSGGGTGGHIYPAIAVAEKIKEKLPGAQILFVGAKGKMEMSKVPEAGFEIEGLWISGLQRKLTSRNLLFPFKLVASLFRAYWILKEFKPDVVAGFGGYASGATMYMATLMNIPTLIQEQNSFPGITNKLLNKKVDKVCVAYEAVMSYFEKDKVVLTGNPIRNLAQSENTKSEAVVVLGMDPNKKTVLFIGGSLGAKSFNECISGGSELINSWEDIQLFWQTGSGYYEDYENSKTAQLPNVYCHAYISDMANAYRAADLVVCRAGALTIAELTVLGKACILIPSPNVAEDHQTKNAMALSSKGAAIVIKDENIKSELLDSIERLLKDEKQLSKLEMASIKLGFPKATEAIAKEIINLKD